jgi:hypothetical protein
VLNALRLADCHRSLKTCTLSVELIGRPASYFAGGVHSLPLAQPPTEQDTALPAGGNLQAAGNRHLGVQPGGCLGRPAGLNRVGCQSGMLHREVALGEVGGRDWGARVLQAVSSFGEENKVDILKLV